MSKKTAPLITQCCQCKRYRWFRFWFRCAWTRGMRLSIDQGEISHGYCPRCYRKTKRQINAPRARVVDMTPSARAARKRIDDHVFLDPPARS